MSFSLRRLLLVGSVGLGVTEVATAEPVPMKHIDEEFRVLIERSVSERFYDPWSTQFGRLSSNMDVADGTILTCGMVNAKSTAGGYTGFVPFYVIWSFSHGIETVEVASGPEDNLARNFCLREKLELTIWP